MAARKRSHKKGHKKAKKKDATGSFLDAYRRIRKPMPPAEQVLADRRRRMQEEDARRDIEEGSSRDDPSDG